MELVYKYYFLKWLLEHTKDEEIIKVAKKCIDEIEQCVSEAHERLYGNKMQKN